MLGGKMDEQEVYQTIEDNTSEILDITDKYHCKCALKTLVRKYVKRFQTGVILQFEGEHY